MKSYRQVLPESQGSCETRTQFTSFYDNGTKHGPQAEKPRKSVEQARLRLKTLARGLRIRKGGRRTIPSYPPKTYSLPFQCANAVEDDTNGVLPALGDERSVHMPNAMSYSNMPALYIPVQLPRKGISPHATNHGPQPETVAAQEATRYTVRTHANSKNDWRKGQDRGQIQGVDAWPGCGSSAPYRTSSIPRRHRVCRLTL
eukprot:2306927-Rhodomonas_salina.3